MTGLQRISAEKWKYKKDPNGTPRTENILSERKKKIVGKTSWRKGAVEMKSGG